MNMMKPAASTWNYATGTLIPLKWSGTLLNWITLSNYFVIVQMCTHGVVFLLFLCQTENLIIQWALENVLIEICQVFIIYCSSIGTR